MSKIGIILAAYQGAAYLNEQIKSILSSHNQNWKLLICDDGSSDDTVNIAIEYEKLYPEKIRLHRNARNLGPTQNFFNGLRLLKKSAEYFMFSDQDDVWFPEKLDFMLGRMKRLEKKYGEDCPLLVFSDAKVTDADLNILHNSYHASQGLDVYKRRLSHLLMENKCSGCMMMMNAALAKKVKEVPRYARYHDWWLALIAASFGHISYIKQPLLFYRQHENNVVGNQGGCQYLISRLKNQEAQRAALLANQRQAREFLKVYYDELSENKKEIITAFSNLHNEPWLIRRRNVIRYGFLKSKWIRNAGVLLFI